MRKIFATFLAAILLSVFAFQVQGVNAQDNGKSPVTSPCKPGNGFGDKNHCHSGPPGQRDKDEKHDKQDKQEKQEKEDR